MADDYSDIEANGDPSSVTFGADNGMTLANMKGVEDITDERWSTLMDQLTLEECLIRTGLGGTSTKVIESITSPKQSRTMDRTDSTLIRWASMQTPMLLQEILV